MIVEQNIVVLRSRQEIKNCYKVAVLKKVCIEIILNCLVLERMQPICRLSKCNSPTWTIFVSNSTRYMKVQSTNRMASCLSTGGNKCYHGDGAHFFPK